MTDPKYEKILLYGGARQSGRGAMMYHKGYIDGLIEGIKRFAWWKDGQQWVGTKPWSLNQVIEEIIAYYKDHEHE